MLNCARLANMEHYQQLAQAPSFQPQPAPPPLGYHERLETPPPAAAAYRFQPQMVSGAGNVTTTPTTNGNCDASAAGTTLHPYDHYPFRESQSGRATPFPAASQQTTTVAPATAPPAGGVSVAAAPVQPVVSNAANAIPASSAPSAVANVSVSSNTSSTSSAASSAANSSCDSSDSGYADDDSTRSINWSSVLSLSSQSALDPLNNNDLFNILPAAATPPAAVPVCIASSSSSSNSSGSTLAFSGSFTTVQASGSQSQSGSSCGNSSGASSSTGSSSICSTSPSSSTTATFTTLSTISSATHSLTSSYVSSISSNVSAGANTWEYGFLDMEFGLGSEFTELVPSCKLSSDELFKSGLGALSGPVASSRLHDNELEQPAHIMVGS